MNAQWCQRVLIVILIGLLTACGTSTPPLGLAPSKQLVQKAIALQLSQTQQRLTQQLQASPPKFEVPQVKLKQLEAIFVEDLPTYHVRGTYNLKFNLPAQQVTQENNTFDIYLQRQKEGKTWRLLRPEVTGKNTAQVWRSYLIR
ncbi:MAG: hypothetical protein KME06_01115 [Kastovskya adunca ATA6-11-RM4]|jgi:hypothetical protein|nr:hypothetical protein [Kastovskya adunca ATA6-11-RM4]